MRVQQYRLTLDAGWSPQLQTGAVSDASLVLAFGSPSWVKAEEVLASLPASFPQAIIVGCSTAGEIESSEVFDDSLCITAVSLEKATVRVASAEVDGPSDSYQ